MQCFSQRLNFKEWISRYKNKQQTNKNRKCHSLKPHLPTHTLHFPPTLPVMPSHFSNGTLIFSFAHPPPPWPPSPSHPSPFPPLSFGDHMLLFRAYVVFFVKAVCVSAEPRRPKPLYHARHLCASCGSRWLTSWQQTITSLRALAFFFARLGTQL